MESRTPQEPTHVTCRASFPLRAGVGTLFVVGGAGTPWAIHEEFFRLAGGPRARVMHVPSGTSAFGQIAPADRREEYAEFYKHGPESFDFLHTYDRAVAEDPDFARPLDGATGVWIGGGDQNRVAELFLDTEVVAGMRRVLERGGVVGGTSSGAAILSDVMICRGYEEVELGRGFALYPRAILDPHFSGRGRHGRLARAVLQRPDQIAVGVDEWTALLVQGERVGVIGREGRGAYYHFADPAAGVVRRYRLAAGEALDLGEPVLGAEHAAVEALLRDGRTPDVLTAEQLAQPDPE
jgi:cyanophycinase